MRTALRDLTGIVKNIKRGSPNHAALFEEKVFDLVKNLGDMPYLGRKVPEYNDDSTRENHVSDMIHVMCPT
jgi:plasmid stabilization system protein ParE